MYWCADFDVDDALDHGLQIDAWLLQYQYEHGGSTTKATVARRDEPQQRGSLCAKLRSGIGSLPILRGMLSSPVGQVVKPKRRKWQSRAAEHFDTIQRTVRESHHLYFDGVVKYRDAAAFYEDFTDDWNHPITDRGPGYPEFWPYAQRIDVAQWKRVVPEGVTVSGLAAAAPLRCIGNRCFPSMPSSPRRFKLS
jgi:hypothetical protein